MRRPYLVIALLFAAITLGAELNTTEFEGGENWTLDGTHFVFVAPYINASHITINGSGRILKVAECILTRYHRFCLNTSDNDSSEIDFYTNDYNITLSRIIDTTREIGDVYDVTLTVENTAELPTTIHISEWTNGTVTNTRDFASDMTWSGTLNAGQTQSLRYELVATRAGTVGFNATVIGTYNATHNATLIVTDFLTTTTDFTENVSADKRYNFTLTLRNRDTAINSNITVRFTIAPTLVIHETGNLSLSGGNLISAYQLNATLTQEHWFTYSTPAQVDNGVLLEIETEFNGTDATRTYHYDINASDFSHLAIIHDHENKTLEYLTEYTLPVQLYNPNNYSLSVEVVALGRLIDLDETVTVPALNSYIVDLVVTPNATNAQYGILLTLTYDNENDEEIVQEEFIRFFSSSGVGVATMNTTNISNQTEVYVDTPIQLIERIVVSGPRAAGPEDPITLLVQFIDPQHELGLLRVEKNGNVTEETTVPTNGTLTITVQGSGTYTLTLNDDAQAIVTIEELDESIVPEEPEAPEEEKEPRSYGSIGTYLVIGLALALLILGALGIIRVHNKHRVHVLSEEIPREQQELAEKTAELANWYPQTGEDVHRRAMLEEEIRVRDYLLHKKIEELERKR